jgi:hypothetical protein
MGLADTSLDLAAACDASIQAINKQRSSAGYTETGGEAATLDHLVSSLQDRASNLRTAGVAACLEAAADPLAKIQDATTQAKAAVANLKAADQMITLAGSLISLATAAATGNIPAIATSAAAVISEATQLMPKAGSAGI